MSHPTDFSRRARWSGGESLVSVLMAKALTHPELTSLAAGFVENQTLPVDATARAFEAVWSVPERAREALQYGTTIGYPPLRQAIVDRLVSCDGLPPGALSADHVVITPGSNQLLYLVACVLCDPGDVVLCGAPSYFVYLATLRGLGIRSIGVAVDQRGMVPEALEEQLERLERQGQLGRVKAIYVTSYFDNPTGLTLAAERRGAMVETARRWSKAGKIYIIEDTAYRELRYWGDDVPSLRSFDPSGETVIQAGTFSKSYSPGIRVGWGVLPPELVEPVLTAKGNLDFGSPQLNQVLMSTVLELGLFDRHLEVLRQGYRTKVEATMEAAERFLGPLSGVQCQRPNGGLYVWLRLPEGVDTGPAGRLFDLAAERGVLYVPGQFCYPAEGPPVPRNRIRLSFGTASCEEIGRGIEALAGAIRQVTG